MKIFIDMDGVVADFIGGVSRLLEINLDPWPIPGELLVSENLKKLRYTGSAWERIRSASPDFFADLYPTDLLQSVKDFRLSEYEDMYFLTSCGDIKKAYEGKMTWIEKFFRDMRHSVITASDKELLARHDRLLIDDCDDNVRLFRAAGGKAVLVPRPWNSRHAESLGAVKHPESLIDEIKEAILECEVF